jgi:hypothetical protein
VNPISDTTSTEHPVTAPESGRPAADVASVTEPSGFGSRGRIRRRARFLRKARELAYRDLGGLVFNLHRFGQRNDALVLAKLTTVAHIDTELRTLETALGRREPVTVLREAGINACPRCAAIHSSEDHFCPNCGLSMARHVDLPIAGAPSTPSSATPTPPSNPIAPVPPATQSPSASQQRQPETTDPPPPPSTIAPVPAPGRSLLPPERGAAMSSAQRPPAEESTEILKPQQPGS